jgi:hypothetical protein
LESQPSVEYVRSWISVALAIAMAHIPAMRERMEGIFKKRLETERQGSRVAIYRYNSDGESAAA